MGEQDINCNHYLDRQNIKAANIKPQLRAYLKSSSHHPLYSSYYSDLDMSKLVDFVRAKLGLKRERFPVLFTGQDGAGKTVALFMLATGKLVTTMPTIGMIFEAFEHRNMEMNIFDVGGCGNMRHIYRLYTQLVEGYVFFLNATSLADYVAKDLEHVMSYLNQEKNPMVIVITHLDKADAKSMEEIIAYYELDTKYRELPIVKANPTTGEGLPEMLDVLQKVWLEKKQRIVVQTEASEHEENVEKMEKMEVGTNQDPESEEEKRERIKEERIQEWLQVEDEPDEEFEKKLLAYSLDNWDHRTHLRIAWHHLHKYGRREGMALVFQRIENYIDHSDQTSGRKFHHTMTYFWVHMVHYAMASTQFKANDFAAFLLTHVQLCEGGLFLNYFSKSLMLESEVARNQVVLPDLKPLPSLISSTSPSKTSRQVVPAPRIFEDAADSEFVDTVERGLNKHWDHASLLRLIYCLMCSNGRNAKQVLEVIRKVEKEHYHDTINYFWIQMVHYVMAQQGIAPKRDSLSSSPSFAEFKHGKGFDVIQDTKAHENYYSRDLVYSPQAQAHFVLPDLKPLPSLY